MADMKTGIFAKNVQKRLNRAQEKVWTATVFRILLDKISSPQLDKHIMQGVSNCLTGWNQRITVNGLTDWNFWPGLITSACLLGCALDPVVVCGEGETEAVDERQNTEETKAKEKFIGVLRPEEKQEHGAVWRQISVGQA
ncbi:hypothetical protein DUI87_18694 [Hirundo rustica rustica]|uniref:Uncharacterized protein n=1 Tax=Hirundo rustica rustica TaxID=333673 RepID=A0A3M0JZB8_HIRRU|nr:hypothetical protein DUI87_18694 [Hirundo rustica rustica]